VFLPGAAAPVSLTPGLGREAVRTGGDLGEPWAGGEGVPSWSSPLRSESPLAVRCGGSWWWDFREGFGSSPAGLWQDYVRVRPAQRHRRFRCAWLDIPPVDRWPVPSCAARSVADGGRRPTIRVLTLTLTLTLGLPCWADRTRFAAVPDLTSPGSHDGGGEVRNALSSALCASGQASRAPARSAGAQ
jgi:hypothetical protein